MRMTQLVPFLVLIGQLGASAAVLLAGSAKLADPSAIRGVISALGVPWPSAVAFCLAVGELATGLSLILLPGAWVTTGCVIALALIFTGAAVMALRRHLQVECACFGAALAARLGWRQILFAPVWVAVGVSVVTQPVALPGQRLSLAFAVITCIAVGALCRLAPLLIEHRTQRLIIYRGG
jgi:uncharacterized membrane protein YphA (DoxX/SURF4 family)